MYFAASASDTFLQRRPMTMPNSPSYTILPVKPAGRSVDSPGPMMDVEGVMRNSGCDGASLPSFAAKALKLFHNATILEGTQGASSANAPASIVVPVGRGESK